jgi:oligopeptide/dipeptide ABC transporter ATP-binding protein
MTMPGANPTGSADAPLLEVEGLVKHFAIRGPTLFSGERGKVHAVNGVSFTLDRGETLALVGESGCGKTTCARAVAQLTRPDAGTVRFKGRDLGRLSRQKLKAVRRSIALVFQDPFGSLNPRLPVGAIVAEPLKIHRQGRRAERQARMAEVIEAVGLKAADAERYPHEFSGGQRQRIAIARALVAGPDLIIADEPLSALDVSIQSQILNLLMDLRDAHGLTYLFITHDLAVVDHIADRIAVMYLGHIVETGRRDDVLTRPSHPYTQALIAAVPAPGGGKRLRRSGPGTAEGDVPSPIDPPSGCPFHTRCPKAEAICRQRNPALEPTQASAAEIGTDAHLGACHFKD